MATAAEVDRGQNSKELFVFAKGAPEVLRERYNRATLPANYDDVYKYYMRMGRRVLALGYKKLNDISVGALSSLARVDAEKDLEFAGFVVFECPLKPDSLATITTLKNSSHKVYNKIEMDYEYLINCEQVAMITGDNTLTACQVAKDLAIIDFPALILTPTSPIDSSNKSSKSSSSSLTWISANEAVSIRLDDPESPIPKLIRHFDLCVSGESLAHILDTPSLRPYLHYIKVLLSIFYFRAVI